MKFVAPSSEHAINAETDIFGRDEFANGLLNIFKTSDDPLVIALDDEWGTGKTVFARRLAKSAAIAGVKAIYYDAFKRDYNPDVFVSLVSEIIARSPKSDKTKELKDKAFGVAKVIGKTILKGGIRVLTAGAVNASGFDEAHAGIADEVGDAIENDIDKLIDDRLSNAEKDEMSFEAFRNALCALVGKNENGEPIPLLVITDELDRCRPDHALELLETIKHFFVVDHVHFLLVTNLTQMRASVNKRYGQGVNSYDYLEKFIHVSFKFPKLEHHQIKAATKKYMAGILAKLPEAKQSIVNKVDFIDVLSALSIGQNYSLRRIERVASLFSISLKFNNDMDSNFSLIIYLLCDMKISFPALFEKARSGKLKYAEIEDYYRFQEYDQSDIHTFRIMREMWQLLLSEDSAAGQEMNSRFGSAFYRFGQRKEIIPYFANSIFEPIAKK